MSGNKILTLNDVSWQFETEKAICFRNLKDEDIWVPKRFVEYDDSDSTLQIPEWLAMEKELI